MFGLRRWPEALLTWFTARSIAALVLSFSPSTNVLRSRTSASLLLGSRLSHALNNETPQTAFAAIAVPGNKRTAHRPPNRITLATPVVTLNAARGTQRSGAALPASGAGISVNAVDVSWLSTALASPQ